MFAQGYFAPQHFAPQHFPPIADIVIPPSGSAGGTPSGQSFFVPIARKRREIFTRLKQVEPKLSAKAKLRLKLDRLVELDRLDIVALERAIAAAVAALPAGRRVVDPPIERIDITLPAPLLDPSLDDDMNLRLLLLLGC